MDACTRTHRRTSHLRNVFVHTVTLIALEQLLVGRVAIVLRLDGLRKHLQVLAQLVVRTRRNNQLLHYLVSKKA